MINKKPKDGIKLLASENFIADEKDVAEVANFFFTKAGRLDKKMLGEFLAKPSNFEILQHFIKLFDFEGLRVDEALRVLLKTFRLPGSLNKLSESLKRLLKSTFLARKMVCVRTSQSHPLIMMILNWRMTNQML